MRALAGAVLAAVVAAAPAFLALTPASAAPLAAVAPPPYGAGSLLSAVAGSGLALSVASFRPTRVNGERKPRGILFASPYTRAALLRAERAAARAAAGLQLASATVAKLSSEEHRDLATLRTMAGIPGTGGPSISFKEGPGLLAATGDPGGAAQRGSVSSSLNLQTRLARNSADLAEARLTLAERVSQAEQALSMLSLVHLTAPVSGLHVPSSLEIPGVVYDAYVNAAKEMGRYDPSCHLSWQDVAALGRIESDHARYANTSIAANGDTYPSILGPPLNGTGGNGSYRVPPGITWDGPGPWERAVGPMQFLPTTWLSILSLMPPLPSGVPADPNNVYAATLAAGTYLCLSAGPAGMGSRSGIMAAYYSYNHSASYVAEALANALAYGATITPAPTLADLNPPAPSGPPPVPPRSQRRPPAPARPKAKAGKPSALSSSTSPTATKPAAGPSTKPTAPAKARTRPPASKPPASQPTPRSSGS
jgi:hypothetical protein